MNIAVVVAVMAAVLSVYVAALSWRFSAAPGWRDQHWFAFAALTAGAYSALNVPIMLGSMPVPSTVYFTRAQLLLGTLHVASWIRYTAVYLHQPMGRVGRWVTRGLVVGGLLAQVPGVVYTNTVRLRAYEPLHVLYRDPVTTLVGNIMLACLVGSFLPLMIRFAMAGRRGVSHASVHAVALLVLLSLAVNDALNAAGLIYTPYLLDLAYVIPVGVVGYVLTARFAQDARTLEVMRAHLESLVEVRTQELGRAQEALHRSEKLAALGQLAAGVAHEVSSPAAVVAANLAYLEKRIEEGLARKEGLECVRESSVALRRIGAITRQLLHAGQLAASGTTSHPVAVAVVAREALNTARARCPSHVTLTEKVPPDVWVSGEEEMLHQVLVNLVLNGAQAVPDGRPGKVEIRGERQGGRILITVEDDGDGMAPDILRRVFEPFFTTKPFGTGTGLGLAVSRGLIAGLGGELRLDSEAGHGTRAVVDLPEAPGADSPRAADRSAVPAR